LPNSLASVDKKEVTAVIGYLLKQLDKLSLQRQIFAPARGESGYLLVLCSVVLFSLVTHYLLGKKDVSPEVVQLSYFVEPDAREITPHVALKKLKAGEFKNVSAGADSLDLGYMREGVWVLVKFRANPSSQNERFVLQLRHAYISGSYTPLTVTGSDLPSQAFTLGDTKTFVDSALPRNQGFSDIRFISFPISLRAGEDFHALVRLRAHSMSVPFFILPESDFLSSTVKEMAIIAAFFGGFTLLAIYNLMVGVARRELEYVFYGLYVASIALMIVALNGTGHLYVWPGFEWFHLNCSNLLINFSCFFYLAFTLTMFRNAPLHGIESFIWNVLLLGCVVNFLLQITEGVFFASVGANVGALATLVLSLVRAWRARSAYGRLANLFLISESVLFLGALIYCLKMFGLLPSSHFTTNILSLAASMEVILLSFVLSEKMRRTMLEKELALCRLAEAQKNIEESVRDKTLARAARYTAHEVLNPLFALRLKAERIRDEIEFGSTPDQKRQFPPAHQVLQKNREMFHLIDSIIHTIRAIKTLSTKDSFDECDDVILKEVFDDALRMLEAKTRSAELIITAQFTSARRVRARRADVVQVLMNLLANSLDAVSEAEERWIRVTDHVVMDGASGDQPVVEVSVIDSGSGPVGEVREKLFQKEISTKDAAGGMGVGLVFCSNLIQRNGGVIGFDSSGKNTRFYFQLPAAASDVSHNSSSESDRAA
jgi:signal transduction histidine kinase